MERLTNSKGECEKCVGCIEHSNCEAECSAVDDCIDKLKAYEDLEEQGLLLRLPCKIGDTVWCVFTGCTGKHPIVMSDTFDYKMIPYFGIGCFLSRDEAEKALKEQEGRQ